MTNLPVDSCPINLSDEDIFSAMKEIKGYLDITPGDFKEIYNFAFQHAHTRLTRSIRAKDIMTREVISVGRETALKDVADLMHRHGISGIPVVEKNLRVVGIISEKDFLFQLGDKKTRSFMGAVSQCLHRTGCIALSIKEQTAKGIMTSPATTVTEDAPLSEISALLSEKNIRRVPVVDKGSILTGIVTRIDLVVSFCSLDELKR
jgi:CBS domain-containing membrane protein